MADIGVMRARQFGVDWMILDSETIVGGCRTKGHGWPDCGSPPHRPLPGQGGSKRRREIIRGEEDSVPADEPTAEIP
jgi:hypothetical protein